MKTLFVFFITSCSLVFAALPVETAQSSLQSLLPRIIELVTPYVATQAGSVKGYPGLVVGVFRGSESRVFGFGSTEFGKSNIPTGKTIFEIGSVTKVMTGYLFAKELTSGRMKLQDAVRKCTAKETSAFCFQGEAVRWVHLATHTSALPSLPDLSKEDPNNPYGKYTEAQLEAFLAKHKLESSPGKKSEYSNLGANILAYEIAKRRKHSFEELVLREIAQPLGLEDTRVWLNPEQRTRFALGYYDGKVVPYWEREKTAVLFGSGAVRSTADDLMRFLQAEAGVNKGLAVKAIKLSQVEYFKKDPKKGVALFWQVHRDGDREILWHNGGTGGFTSFVAISLKDKTGVVVLANASVDDEKFLLDNLGYDLLLELNKAPAVSK